MIRGVTLHVANAAYPEELREQPILRSLVCQREHRPELDLASIPRATQPKERQWFSKSRANLSLCRDVDQELLALCLLGPLSPLLKPMVGHHACNREATVGMTTLVPRTRKLRTKGGTEFGCISYKSGAVLSGGLIDPHSRPNFSFSSLHSSFSVVHFLGLLISFMTIYNLWTNSPVLVFRLIFDFSVLLDYIEN